MTRSRNGTGFTLVELLVGLGVSAIVIAGALALLVGQQRAHRTTSGERALQESARAGLSEMGMNLRRAGYGIDPWLAFDLGPLTGVPTTTASYACTSPVTCRDQVAGPDEIVFLARDPAFSRRLAALPTGTTLQFTVPLSAALSTGQILQIMCSGGADHAYVTVASTASDLRSVTLDTSRSDTFHEQSRITSGCFMRGFSAAAVLKVDRFRYYVATFADPAHPLGRPYLMLDRGLTEGGQPLLEPVAPDVEDVQFAYVFRNGNVVGRTPSTRLANAGNGVDLAAVPPAYDADTADASRNTNHPANIRAVQVSVVVRNPAFDDRFTSAADRTIPAAANRPAIGDAPAGYRRLLVETTDATRNLDSRAAFMPPFSTNGGADGLNVGGG